MSALKVLEICCDAPCSLFAEQKTQTQTKRTFVWILLSEHLQGDPSTRCGISTCWLHRCVLYWSLANMQFYHRCNKFLQDGRSSSRHRLVLRHDNVQRRITRICTQLLASENTSLLAWHRRLEVARGSLNHRHQLCSAASMPTSVRLLCGNLGSLYHEKNGRENKSVAFLVLFWPELSFGVRLHRLIVTHFIFPTVTWFHVEISVYTSTQLTCSPAVWWASSGLL